MRPIVAQDSGKAMWMQAGIQFRSNLVMEPENSVALHTHSYDHVAMITHGWWRVVEIDANGARREYQMASKGYVPRVAVAPFAPVGYRTLVPAWHQHSFTLIECQDQPAEVLCMWASDGVEAHEGC